MKEPLAAKLDRMMEALSLLPGGAGDSAVLVGELRQPVAEAELDAAEAAIGRLLSGETRDLYRWHDGSIYFAAIDYDRLDRRVSLCQRMVSFTFPPLSNASGSIERGELFPVLNIDALLICVRTTLVSRVATSTVVVLDSELDQLTVVASSLGAFFDRLTQELSNGNAAPSEQGITWQDGTFLTFPPTMTPFGDPPDPVSAG